METITKITETQFFNFYGTDRHGHPFHPSERMDECVEFQLATSEVAEDGEIIEYRATPEAWLALHAAVDAHARGLLANWPDQPGIRIQERGDREGRFIYSSRRITQWAPWSWTHRAEVK